MGSAVGTVAVYEAGDDGSIGPRIAHATLDFTSNGLKEAAFTGVSITQGRLLWVGIHSDTAAVTVRRMETYGSILPVFDTSLRSAIYLIRPSITADVFPVSAPTLVLEDQAALAPGLAFKVA